ncbi:MAG: PaaI family thioesterase [Desulfarculus sp.]|nr:PaaI family thioesterase [Desulfarculus sp.]
MAKGQDDGLLPGLVDTPTRRTLRIRYLRSGLGWLEADFKPSARFTNHVGNVQGGILGAFLDNVMGQCCHAAAGPEQALTTTEMSLYFLAPAPLGRLLGKARVIKRGRRLFFVEGEVRDLQGNPLVRAVATMLVMRRPRPGVEGPVPGEPGPTPAG